jgi:hypothetical protein
MNTKGMTKYLIMVILMTSINIPLLIYSRSFLKSDHSNMEAGQTIGGTPPLHAVADEQNNHDELPASHEEPPTAESKALDEKSSVKAEPPPLANLYRPPLLGKCKKLFERFMRQTDPGKPYRAFVYSFDGETAYCAGAVTDKSKEKAEEIARKDCEENQASTGKYSPCRIYTSEETN